MQGRPKVNELYNQETSGIQEKKINFKCENESMPRKILEKI